MDLSGWLCQVWVFFIEFFIIYTVFGILITPLGAAAVGMGGEWWDSALAAALYAAPGPSDPVGLVKNGVWALVSTFIALILMGRPGAAEG
ncbi:hypothetical protein [Methanofollis fontis]|uniref:Uncharacterized protein n=1 Tax=Methanofollis fontis TaxID=2052832 RepID=A0A483CRT1_9EURY|nr:hypothetical protein [Methanofollis fontis]TAJ44921.1 hypothetical protein CUJ86_06475 [Methanofollis fontis]